MRAHSKLLLAALTAALVLAAAVSTASGTRLETSSQSIRTVWTSLEFTGFGGLFGIRCPVTLEGTVHSRTISKVSGQLIGFITRASLGEASCSGGSVTTLPASLPWHLRYDSFRGALPRIEGVRIQIIGYSWRLRVRILGSEVLCLYKSTERGPLFGILEVNGETGRIEGLKAGEETEIPILEGIGACPATAQFRGRASVTVLGAVTAITVRLVAESGGPARLTISPLTRTIASPGTSGTLTIRNEGERGARTLTIREIGLSDAVGWGIEDTGRCLERALAGGSACEVLVFYRGPAERRPRTSRVIVETTVGAATATFTAER
jgi:hypothetical protein